MRTPKLIPSMRGDERRDVFVAFFTLFTFMTGFALLETARDALFLASLPASRLAGAYLIIAILTLTLTQLDRILFRGIAAGNELRFSLYLSSIVTWVFSVLSMTGDARVFFALYIWTGVVATLVVVRFWTALGTRFTVVQAKRLFAFVGSGSVLGAIVGSFFARLLSEVGPPQTMLFFAAAGFLASGFVLRVTRGDARPPVRETLGGKQNWSPQEVLDLIWSRPYLRRVTVLVLAASISFTLVDYIFKSVIDRRVAPADMGEVFASVYLALHVASLAVQLIVVSRLVRRFGVVLANAVVPSLFLLGSVGYAAVGGLAFAYILKGIDGSLRHSLYRTSVELLFVPVTGELRARVKAFIDVLGQRGGQALASLLILALLTLGSRDIVFALAAMTISLVWFFLAIALRRHYLNVFRDTLGREITETRVRFPALDLASLETLLSTLSDGDDRRVLAALDLLAEQGKIRVIPTLILYHPSPTVVLRAIEIFRTAARTDYYPVIERLRDHQDPRVRASILSARAASDPSLWVAGASDPSHVVRATALVGLVSEGRASEEQKLQLHSIATRGEVEARFAMAQEIGRRSAPVFDDFLVLLAHSEHQVVRAAAVAAMREQPSDRHTHVLIPLLADRSLRDSVRACLVAIGSKALEGLASALEDDRVDYAIRRRLPKAIGIFLSDEAARILVNRLMTETDGLIRFQMLSALGRMKSRRPDLRLDDAILERVIDKTMEAAVKISSWRRILVDRAQHSRALETRAQSILVELLRHKQIQTLERLFRLFNLLHPNEDLPRIFHGLQSSDRETLSSSRELVETAIPQPRRETLLQLIDALFDGVAPGPEVTPSYENVLENLLFCSNESLSALAAFHIGEAGLNALADELRAARERFSDRYREVVGQALQRLESPAAEEVIRAR